MQPCGSSNNCNCNMEVKKSTQILKCSTCWCTGRCQQSQQAVQSSKQPPHLLLTCVQFTYVHVRIWCLELSSYGGPHARHRFCFGAAALTCLVQLIWRDTRIYQGGASSWKRSTAERPSSWHCRSLAPRPALPVTVTSASLFRFSVRELARLQNSF